MALLIIELIHNAYTVENNIHIRDSLEVVFGGAEK